MEEEEESIDNVTQPTNNENVSSVEEDFTTVSSTQNLSSTESSSSSQIESMLLGENRKLKRVRNTSEKKIIQEEKGKEIENKSESEKTSIVLEKKNTEIKEETQQLTNDREEKELNKTNTNNEVKLEDSEEEEEDDEVSEISALSVIRNPSSLTRDEIQKRDRKVLCWKIEGICEDMNSLLKYLKEKRRETEIILSSYVWNSSSNERRVKIFLKFLQAKDKRVFEGIPLSEEDVDHAGKGYFAERESVESFGKPLYNYYKGLENDFYSERIRRNKRNKHEMKDSSVTRTPYHRSPSSDSRAPEKKVKDNRKQNRNVRGRSEKRKINEDEEEDIRLIKCIYKVIKSYEEEKN